MIKRFTLILLTLICVSLSSIAQWTWANTFGSRDRDYCTGITTDANDNIYVVGNFEDSTLVVDSMSYVNKGATDFYLVKYDSNGNIIWVVTDGGIIHDKLMAVCTDAAGNAYVAGYFSSHTLIIGNDTLLSIGNTNGEFFVAKYDANGNALWARKAMGTSVPFGIKADNNGNVIVSGSFYSAPTTTLTMGAYTINNLGTYNIFLTKLDSSGNVLWLNGYGGTGPDESFGVSLDAANNIYFNGYFHSDSLMIGTSTIANNGTNDAYLAKLDENGNSIWALAIGSSGNEKSFAITTDETGAAYIVGDFFGPTLQIGNTTLTSSSMAMDVFVAKYDSAGQPLWAKSMGGTNTDNGKSICYRNGKLSVAGDFHSSVFSAGTFNLPLNGSQDMFFCEFDTAGNILNADRGIDLDSDDAWSTAIDGSGNLLVLGRYMDNMQFDNINMTSTGDWDVFVAKHISVNVIVSEPTGKLIRAKVYPSPADEYINIELPTQENAIATIIDVTGKIVLTKNISGISKINIGELAKGNYSIHINYSNGEKEVIKFIVK